VVLPRADAALPTGLPLIYALDLFSKVGLPCGSGSDCRCAYGRTPWSTSILATMRTFTFVIIVVAKDLKDFCFNLALSNHWHSGMSSSRIQFPKSTFTAFALASFAKSEAVGTGRG
jgi:hypothetical protein